MLEKNPLDKAEFIELVLAHIIRSKDVFDYAKKLKITADDFLATTQFGIQLYKLLAETAFEINSPPIDGQLFCMVLQDKLEQNPSISCDEAAAIVSRLYGLVLNEEYVIHNLHSFVKRRRQQKAKVELTDIDVLRTELNKIAVELDEKMVDSHVTSEDPFAKIEFSTSESLIGTGINTLDQAIGGLSRGGYGLIIGYSGGGKTALATNFALKGAGNGYKVVYFALEENKHNIRNRFYSNLFKVSYTDLHRGVGNLELQQKAAERTESRNKLIGKIRIEDLKAVAPVTTETLKGRLDTIYKEYNFAPDIVIIDQMDFLEPNIMNTKEARWSMYERLTYDCDNLSSYKIGGTHEFCLWVLHQATGKLKRSFTNQEIAGFKGINRPADTVIGIGRDGPMSNEFNVFTLKSRHTKNCELQFIGDLEHMDFIDTARPTL